MLPIWTMGVSPTSDQPLIRRELKRITSSYPAPPRPQTGGLEMRRRRRLRQDRACDEEHSMPLLGYTVVRGVQPPGADALEPLLQGWKHDPVHIAATAPGAMIRAMVKKPRNVLCNEPRGAQ
jgi:hypothetical protein